MKHALIIMAKEPAPGKTKTRLCPPLSHVEAAQLYGAFLQDVIELARDVARRVPQLRPFIAYAPEAAQSYFQALAPDFSLVPQQGATLGERLDFVLTSCLSQGYQHVAAINSDSPTLPVDHLVQAFHQLETGRVDVVFGPAEDGGYYLIGLTRPWPRIVREVKMSTPNVLQESLMIAAEESARSVLLPSWYDVDTVEELQRLHSELENEGHGRASHTAKSLQGLFIQK
ncbi:MAG: TIGR04282 family arsenosugar biosynthesis glycosyltransferase [Chloroflexota bacterium]